MTERICREKKTRKENKESYQLLYGNGICGIGEAGTAGRNPGVCLAAEDHACRRESIL